jgi:hypothetical protein
MLAHPDAPRPRVFHTTGLRRPRLPAACCCRRPTFAITIVSAASRRAESSPATGPSREIRPIGRENQIAVKMAREIASVKRK